MQKILSCLVVACFCSLPMCFAQGFDMSSMSGASAGQQNNTDNLTTAKGQNSIMGVQNYQGVTATQTPTSQGLQHTYYGSLAPVFGFGGGNSSANSSTAGPGGPNWANNWETYSGLSGGAQGGDFSSGDTGNPNGTPSEPTGTGTGTSGTSGTTTTSNYQTASNANYGSLDSTNYGTKDNNAATSSSNFDDLVGLFSNTF